MKRARKYEKMLLTKFANCEGKKGAFFMNQREKGEQRQLWIARLYELEESGVTQEEWCKNHNIAYSTLRYWIRKLKKEAETEEKGTNWLKVDLSAGNSIAAVCIPETSDHTSSINIRHGEFSVELQRGADLQQAFEVLKMLKAL